MVAALKNGGILQSVELAERILFAECHRRAQDFFGSVCRRHWQFLSLSLEIAPRIEWQPPRFAVFRVTAIAAFCGPDAFGKSTAFIGRASSMWSNGERPRGDHS
jgi:hypothetical protein